MEHTYFSDRELGPRARVEQEISPRVWRVIIGVIESLVASGAFGIDFPMKDCADGDWITGTNQKAFFVALQGEVPEIEYPFRTTINREDDLSPVFGIAVEVVPDEPYTPDTPVVLDLIEFCHQHVSSPIQSGFHSYFGHNHLTFDREAGQESYRAQINRIFTRNGITYELRDNGTVERLAPPVLRDTLRSAVFSTGDAILDELLERARTKFLSHDPKNRRESLEKLWDAWERLKTLNDPSNKKLSVTVLLDQAAPEPGFRSTLETEAKELTRIGNDFQIRHSEINKVVINNDADVDYLFHRLFSLIFLLMRK